MKDDFKNNKRLEGAAPGPAPRLQICSQQGDNFRRCLKNVGRESTGGPSAALGTSNLQIFSQLGDNFRRCLKTVGSGSEEGS